MRIGILTASRTNNIGTDLQALAMQWLFRSCGENSVELINYKCDKLENSRKVLSRMNLHGLLSIPYNIAKIKNHSSFRKKYFQYSKQEFTKTNLFEIDYDLTVVGSDQIWNQEITGNDLNFFLPFQIKGLKASYAASVSEENIERLVAKYNLNNLLESFLEVSVREKKAAEVLKSHHIEAKFDLDPLLMIDSNKWDEISASRQINRGYVFVYVVDRVSKSVQFALDYAKKHDLDVYMWGNIIKPIKGIKPIRFKGIEEWLFFMKNAELVVTNSYHGLSFALNFKKNFAIFSLKNADINVRLENILELSGLSLKPDGEIYTPDWNLVCQALDSQRKNSRKYIESLIERAK